MYKYTYVFVHYTFCLTYIERGRDWHRGIYVFEFGSRSHVLVLDNSTKVQVRSERVPHIYSICLVVEARVPIFLAVSIFVRWCLGFQ